ncbi:diguanylate cyclase [Caballeronia sp. LZ062]|uniref:sensor domain-containing diguanylate cyclase n=1 Tax=unclassified Caballeronia TaxID=2646786 RepID=UPI00285FC512|nr:MULTISPECIES: diguanylate cyclase [unclassified Caballeronia]MDR5854019.1 diguanylate cyclase [Caballeronia sp. LZ050]MDR5871450.1 diguanylate cyclase [Caballeronia sp. LZ062]
MPNDPRRAAGQFTPAPTHEDAADMFDLAPVSLWLEDFSGVREQFDRWREAGVTDLRAFLAKDASRIAECSSLIRVVKVNQRTLSLFGAREIDHLVQNLGRVFRDDMLTTHVDELEQLWSGKQRFVSQTVNYTLDGRRLDVLLKAVILPGHEDTWSRVLVTIEDITELETVRRKATQSERYARGLFEHSPVSLWVENFSAVKTLLDDVRERGIVDFRTFVSVHPEFVERCMQEIHVLDVNQHTLRMFAAPDKATLLARLPEIFRDDMRQHFQEQLIDLWEHKLFHQREVVNYSLDGNEVHVHLQFSVFPGHEAGWDLVLVALTDITARKKAEAYLEFLGKHDVLTKLKNRSFYDDEINRLERKGPFPVTAIAVDVNGLKGVNDQLGHAAGDALLRRAGEVLGKAIEKPYHAARIGGDEFMVLLPGTDERGGDTVMDSIRQLLEVNNQFYSGMPLSFAMGAATMQDGERLEAMLQRADAAMYADKRRQYAQGSGEDA